MAEWRRLRTQALHEGATIIVLEITTPGGSVDATKEIMRDLIKLRRDGTKTAAYIPYEAWSGGAMIALATHNLFLGTGAGMGNAIVIWDGMEGLTEKIPAKFGTYTKDLADLVTTDNCPFDPLIVQSFVDERLDLWGVRGEFGNAMLFSKEELKRKYSPDRIEREGLRELQLVRPDQAFTFRADETNELTMLWLKGNLDYRTVPLDKGRDALPKLLGLGDRPLADEEVLRIPPPVTPLGLFEDFKANIDWSILLLLAGLVFFILEFQSPGLGAPGALGVLSLVGYFAANAGSGLPVILTSGLLILGFLLILAEILIIPGFGVAGIAGGLLILFAIYAATIGLPGDTLGDQIIPDGPADWIRVQSWGLTFLIATVGGAIGSLFLVRHLDKVPILNRAYVKAPVLEPVRHDEGFASSSLGTVKVPLGQRGTTTTDLRPAGRARFPEGDLDVVSEGGYIEQGAAIEVCLVEGNRIVVRAQEPSS